MQLHEKEARMVYSETLCDLIKKNPDIYCLEADLAKATGTFGTVREECPDNFIDTGVQEANLIGVAAGLANEGKRPFAATFSCFASRRVYDQITISVAYAKNNVKIIGTAPGVTQGPNGGTHMCFQDLAIMRAMPNMEVYSPCDAYEIREVTRYLAQTPNPAYMQLLRPVLPAIFDEDYKFTPGKAVRLSQGDQVTLVATGFMTAFAKQAVQELKEEGVSVELLHYPVIKPFDDQALAESVKKTGSCVVVENQNIIGGLGGAVCESLAENYPAPVKRLGVPDAFGEVATEDYLLEKHGFSLGHIKAACIEFAPK
jgi:transketolase